MKTINCQSEDVTFGWGCVPLDGEVHMVLGGQKLWNQCSIWPLISNRAEAVTFMTV